MLGYVYYADEPNAPPYDARYISPLTGGGSQAALNILKFVLLLPGLYLGIFFTQFLKGGNQEPISINPTIFGI